MPNNKPRNDDYTKPPKDPIEPIETPELSEDDFTRMADEAESEARAEMQAEERAEAAALKAAEAAELEADRDKGELLEELPDEESRKIVDVEESLPAELDVQARLEMDGAMGGVVAEMARHGKRAETEIFGRGGVLPADHGEPALAELAKPPPIYDDPEATADEAARGWIGTETNPLRQRIERLEGLLATQRHRGVLLPEAPDYFFVRITGSTYANGSGTADGSDPSTKWTYSFSEVYKTAAGYGGWSVLSGGRSGSDTAFNVIEDINTDTGTDRMGNGVVLDNLDYDGDDTFEFAPQPVPDNVIVRMWTVEFRVAGVSTVEFWFAYENGADGGCD